MDGVRKTPGIKTQIKSQQDETRDSEGPRFVPPEGFWTRCEECHAILQQAQVEKNAQVCTECGHHFRIGARRRLELICDEGSFKETDQELAPRDVLKFYDSKAYADRLQSAAKKSRLADAFVSGTGTLKGRRIEVGAFEFSFMGGSMGMVVGEKVARLFERAAEAKAPALIFQASGGARMQEALLSLMQMAKATVALDRLRSQGQPYISILTDPTTGGVAASFAMLGDFNIAEPEALIGFAGPRVIQQTINQKLPENFQRAEYLLEHGMIDAIVPRADLRNYLDRVLTFLL